jgi:hypothetical protein
MQPHTSGAKAHVHKTMSESLIDSTDLEMPMARLSKICRLAPEAKDYQSAATFDRVFFLNCSERHVVELSTILGASRVTDQIIDNTDP